MFETLTAERVAEAYAKSGSDITTVRPYTALAVAEAGCDPDDIQACWAYCTKTFGYWATGSCLAGWASRQEPEAAWLAGYRSIDALKKLRRPVPA